MNSDRDPLLDACLDEVLAGRRPPDLTARIMQAFAAQQLADRSGQADRLALESPPVAPLVVHASSNGHMPTSAPMEGAAANGHLANGQAAVELRRTGSAARSPRRKTAGGYKIAVLAAGILGLAVLGGLAYVATQQPQVARNTPAAANPKLPAQPPAIAGTNNSRPPRTDSPVAPVESVPPLVKPTDPPQVVHQPQSPGEIPPQVARNTPVPTTPTPGTPSPSHAPPSAPDGPYHRPSPDVEVVSFVNAELSLAWTNSGVTPSPLASDSEWCRRLFVRVLGRIPTADEVQGFLSDKAKDKRSKHVDRLLTDENYVEEYARHWSVVWSNILVGRTGGRGDSLADRDGLEQYLRTSLARNKPYNQLVYELLTASGSAKPGTEGYNGAVNFLLDGLDADATLASSRVSRIFLGQQLQCAQCHNHPTHDWTQEQYWAFNSFFRQLKAEPPAGATENSAVQLVNVDFPGQGQGSQEGEVFYETPTGLLKTAFPRFIDGTELPRGGQLATVDRRAELARLVVRSEQMPKALVNRLWQHFFGYGFTQPVDDMGLEATASHPELLDRLTQEFVAHDYDLKSVIRWIALSDPFSRSSKLTSIATKDMPEAGEVALFSRYYSRQMQAEEVYNSLAQAAQIRKTAANAAEVEQARVDWLAQFSKSMATDDAMEESHFNGSLRQSLIMMNGDLMQRAVSTQHEGLLKSVAASPMKFDKKVEHLFLSALSREPTKRELQAAATILLNNGGNEATALEDTWWALLNSNEFILDH